MIITSKTETKDWNTNTSPPAPQREVNFAIEDWILKIEPKVTDRVDAVDEVGASV